jgi:hypothetical protein
VIVQDTTHTILTVLGNSDEAPPGGHGDSEPIYEDSTGSSAPEALLEPPTTQAVEADLAKWSADVAKGLTGDENILNAMISRAELTKIGTYVYPFANPEGNPFGRFSKETLIAYRQGTCGNWSEFFSAAARLQNITVVRNSFLTRKPPFAGVTDWAQGFKTKQVTPIGGAPQIYDFSDHEWIEYGANRIVYDPSFAMRYNVPDAPAGTTVPQLWKAYLRDKIIDPSKFWVRKPASLPGNVWRVVAQKNDLTQDVLVAEGVGNYGFFTFSGRWNREKAPDQPITTDGDGVLLIQLGDPPA